MLGLRLGQEIEYKVKGHNAKRQPAIKHGVVRHITDRMLVIQLDQYRDTIQVADLVSGQVELVKPAMPSGLVLVNRIKRDDPKRPSNTKGLYVIDHLAEKRNRQKAEKRNRQKAEKRNRQKADKAREGRKRFVARKGIGLTQQEEKLMAKERYDWDKLLPEAIEMASKGINWATIAKRLDVPYGTLYGHLRAADISQRLTKAPEPPEPPEEKEPEEKEPDIKCPEENIYTARINARLSAQIAKGMAKYGQPLEHNLASQSERLEHLAQELTDGLMYIEWIKDAQSSGA